MPNWVLPFVIAPLLVAGLGYLIGKIYGRLNTVGVLVGNLLGSTEETADELAKAKAKVQSLEDRVAYLESQVGDQLTNLMVGQTLKAQGVEVGPIKRELSAVSEPGMDSRWSVDEKHLITRGRALLFQAAQEARKHADAKGDLDKLTSQAWLIMQIRSMITEGFGFRLFKDIEDELEIRDKKRKHEGKSTNAAETLNFLADFCEGAIPGLKPEDVAELYKLPPTFGEFMKTKQ